MLKNVGLHSSLLVKFGHKVAETQSIAAALKVAGSEEEQQVSGAAGGR